MNLFSSGFMSQLDELKPPRPEFLGKIPDYDLLSPCQFYSILYNECRTFASEGTNIWITGERAKCDHWNEAAAACEKWRDTEDREALDKVLSIERKLFKFRQIDTQLNTVWKLRELGKGQPPHFNAPLPPYIYQPQ